MNAYILVNFIMISLMVKVPCNGLMEESMMVSGRWMICMGKALLYGLMEGHMKEAGATINPTAPPNSSLLLDK